MNVDKIIVFTAMTIGMGQMMYDMSDLYNIEKKEDYNLTYILSGIFASLLWTVYQYRNNQKYYALYSSISVMIGLYTLSKLQKRKTPYVSQLDP
jgi:hypothetical protein